MNLRMPPRDCKRQPALMLLDPRSSRPVWRNSFEALLLAPAEAAI
jgi:hypothetical protein